MLTKHSLWLIVALLTDVLRSAQMIGEHAKLIIEIKPGNVEMCLPLISLFARNIGEYF